MSPVVICALRGEAGGGGRKLVPLPLVMSHAAVSLNYFFDIIIWRKKHRRLEKVTHRVELRPVCRWVIHFLNLLAAI